jgi:hypothetical protein
LEVENIGAIDKANSSERNLRLHLGVTSSNDKNEEPNSPIGSNADEETKQTTAHLLLRAGAHRRLAHTSTGE